MFYMPDVHESWPFIDITNKICSGTESLPQAAFGQLLETQLNADYSFVLNLEDSRDPLLH